MDKIITYEEKLYRKIQKLEEENNMCRLDAEIYKLISFQLVKEILINLHHNPEIPDAILNCEAYVDLQDILNNQKVSLNKIRKQYYDVEQKFNQYSKEYNDKEDDRDEDKYQN